MINIKFRTNHLGAGHWGAQGEVLLLRSEFWGVWGLLGIAHAAGFPLWPPDPHSARHSLGPQTSCHLRFLRRWKERRVGYHGFPLPLGPSRLTGAHTTHVGSPAPNLWEKSLPQVPSMKPLENCICVLSPKSMV